MSNSDVTQIITPILNNTHNTKNTLYPVIDYTLNYSDLVHNDR